MLESIWFALWGVLWAVYFMLDGFDLGIGSLLPVLGKTETDRRVMINALGPYWDGNEVWLITAGGVTFAAFPTTYAVLFSSLYTPLMLLLFALILRGVAFEFRGKVDSPKWRKVWDSCVVVGSFVPALLLGVAFANIFKGIPIDADGNNQGNLLTLLNPYGLMGGLLFVLLFLMHGSLWLAIKTEGEVHRRAASLAKQLWLRCWVQPCCFDRHLVFRRLYDNYIRTHWHISYRRPDPLMAVAMLSEPGVHRQAGMVKAWAASCAIVGTPCSASWAVSKMLPSSLNPAFNLTIYNSASSPLTLKIMLGVALTFVPVVIAYQTWVYRFFKDKVREDELDYHESY
jgi:cytochrome d ubiquinol oxidase subunit II